MLVLDKRLAAAPAANEDDELPGSDRDQVVPRGGVVREERESQGSKIEEGRERGKIGSNTRGVRGLFAVWRTSAYGLVLWHLSWLCLPWIYRHASLTCLPGLTATPGPTHLRRPVWLGGPTAPPEHRRRGPGRARGGACQGAGASGWGGRRAKAGGAPRWPLAAPTRTTRMTRRGVSGSGSLRLGGAPCKGGRTAQVATNGDDADE